MKKVYLVMMDGFDYGSGSHILAAFETREEAEALVRQYEDAQNTPDDNGYVTVCPDYHYVEEIEVRKAP